jgi:hypothetical protein
VTFAADKSFLILALATCDPLFKEKARPWFSKRGFRHGYFPSLPRAAATE